MTYRPDPDDDHAAEERKADRDGSNLSRRERDDLSDRRADEAEALEDRRWSA